MENKEEYVYVLHNFRYGVEEVFLSKPTPQALMNVLNRYQGWPEVSRDKLFEFANILLSGSEAIEWRYAESVDLGGVSFYLYKARINPSEVEEDEED